MPRQIILASSSPYRRQMLERIGLAFACHAPEIDEAALPGEDAAALVVRLSVAKAKAVAAHYPRALIIGSDQVAEHRGRIIGKPGGHDEAARQLRAMSAATITLHAGVALYNAARDECQTAVEPYEVALRELPDALIERYLAAEQPYDCCGSIKAEGLGIALLRRLRGHDPNALLGLPVIRLIDMLRNEGVELV
ncbi:MAG: Maf family protein [bacterium]